MTDFSSNPPRKVTFLDSLQESNGVKVLSTNSSSKHSPPPLGTDFKPKSILRNAAVEYKPAFTGSFLPQHIINSFINSSFGSSILSPATSSESDSSEEEISTEDFNQISVGSNHIKEEKLDIFTEHLNGVNNFEFLDNQVTNGTYNHSDEIDELLNNSLEGNIKIFSTISEQKNEINLNSSSLINSETVKDFPKNQKPKTVINTFSEHNLGNSYSSNISVNSIIDNKQLDKIDKLDIKEILSQTESTPLSPKKDVINELKLNLGSENKIKETETTECKYLKPENLALEKSNCSRSNSLPTKAELPHEKLSKTEKEVENQRIKSHEEAPLLSDLVSTVPTQIVNVDSKRTVQSSLKNFENNSKNDTLSNLAIKTTVFSSLNEHESSRTQSRRHIDIEEKTISRNPSLSKNNVSTELKDERKQIERPEINGCSNISKSKVNENNNIPLKQINTNKKTKLTKTKVEKLETDQILKHKSHNRQKSITKDVNPTTADRKILIPYNKQRKKPIIRMENVGDLNCAGEPETLSPHKRDDIQEKGVLIWIYNMIDEPARVDYEFFLKDGCILCRLMNRIVPGCIPEDEITWEGARSKQKNISNFLNEAEKFGVPKSKLFFPEDLLHLRHIPRVTRCLYALAKKIEEDPDIGPSCPKIGDEPNFVQPAKKVEVPGHRDTKEVLSQITSAMEKKDQKKMLHKQHSLYN